MEEDGVVSFFRGLGGSRSFFLGLFFQVLVQVDFCFRGIWSRVERQGQAGWVTGISRGFQFVFFCIVFICSFMVVVFFFGYLGDRFNRKVIFSCGIFFWSVVIFFSFFIFQQVRFVSFSFSSFVQFFCVVCFFQGAVSLIDLLQFGLWVLVFWFEFQIVFFIRSGMRACSGIFVNWFCRQGFFYVSLI